ncbi:MAG: hypothetical protein ABW122_09930, partial [Ilumatobacteraceae bacterium]
MGTEYYREFRQATDDLQHPSRCWRTTGPSLGDLAEENPEAMSPAVADFSPVTVQLAPATDQHPHMRVERAPQSYRRERACPGAAPASQARASLLVSELLQDLGDDLFGSDLLQVVRALDR